MNLFSVITSQKLVLVFGGILTGEIARQLWSKWKLYLAGNRNKEITDVLFFPDSKISCKDFFESVGGCINQHCSYTHSITSLRKLLMLIKSARKSIDICVYCISCHELVEAVLKRHKVCVRVRVITDLSMEAAAGAQSYRFMKAGIVVRMKDFPFLMHHKFMIIDDQTIAFGSFNWTSQAVTGNLESVVITNDELIVKPFCSEFQRMWEEMKV